MSTVVYYCASSLDGYIAEQDDTLEWLMGYDGSYEGGEGAPPVEGGYDEFYEGIGAMVAGSATYEFVLDYMKKGHEWMYKGKPFWVLSSRDQPVPEGEGVDVRVVEGKVTDLHDEMIESAGERDFWVVGGGNVASQYADAGLLDEVHVTVVPVVLAKGKPLFDDRLAEPPMQLQGVFPRHSGMVELRYEVNR
jgi:dihydrofolate reductase